jgi:hypothetical protein
MKKPAVRKIVLNKETLLHLNDGALAAALGGVPTQLNISICVTTCKFCPPSNIC